MGFLSRNKYITFVLSLIPILVLAFLAFTFGPNEIADFIGPTHIYWLTFLLAILGGASSLTAGTFFATVATFAAGGANIFLLAFLGGIGMTIGDVFFYIVGDKSRDVLPDRVKTFMEKWAFKFSKLSDKKIWLIIFIYAGFSPFPGDILMFFLALFDYPFKKAVIPLAIANMVLLINISLLTLFGIDFLKNIFV